MGMSLRTDSRTIDVWAFCLRQLLSVRHIPAGSSFILRSVWNKTQWQASKKCAVSLNVADCRNGRRRLCPRITMVVRIVAVPLILLT